MTSTADPSGEAVTFLRLDAADLNALRSMAAETVELDDGEVALRAGNVRVDLFVVESGALNIVNPADGGLIVTHGPGHFAGDADLLTGRPVIVTAVTHG